jgi:hypothetical protein
MSSLKKKKKKLQNLIILPFIVCAFSPLLVQVMNNILCICTCMVKMF